MDDLGVPLFLETPICVCVWKETEGQHIANSVLVNSAKQKIIQFESGKNKNQKKKNTFLNQPLMS